MNSNYNEHESEELDVENLLNRLERIRERRNGLGDTSAVSTNSNITCQKHCYHQLAERVRELEKEIVPDIRFYQIPQSYSPFSAVTPGSNVSGGGIPSYSRPQNFPMNLASPNSSVPMQKYGLSSKVLERAHQIPERFWIDWQQKQMQNRIEELEYIKNNLTSPNGVNSTTANRRKSLLLLHEAQRRASVARPANIYRTVPTSIDTETSSSDDDTDNLPELLTPIPSARTSQSTLDRSRLSINLPFSHTDIPKQTIPTNNHPKSTPEKTIIQTMSSATSVEDIAQIDTELNLTLLLRENQDQTNPLLYSKAIMRRTTEFRSSSKKDSSISENEKNGTILTCTSKTNMAS